MDRNLSRIVTLAQLGPDMTAVDAHQLIGAMSKFFRGFLLEQGYEQRKITALTTKFRDAGRRSAPWRPTSSRVPGRPQDGSDGNRINRWLLPVDHKFYADEITATLVELKYYLQALSMTGAPLVTASALEHAFDWLLEHPVRPGEYRDPVQLIEISFAEVVGDPTMIQSGHLHPLDRGGQHLPANTFLMLGRSNSLQGNSTVEELLVLIKGILDRHDEYRRVHGKDFTVGASRLVAGATPVRPSQ